MLRILTLDQPNVNGEPGRLRQLVQECGGEVRLETAGLRRREVGVGSHERLPGCLDDHHGKRLVRRNDSNAAPGCGISGQKGYERLAERDARFTDLGLGLTRSDLEPEFETARACELFEQVVEHG